MGMAVGQAGATFHLYPEAAARFASSSKEQRQEQTNLVHGYKRVKYSAGGEKGKMKVRKANKGKKDKNLLELV